MSKSTAIVYDCALFFLRVIANLFFREIRPRGAWNIPKDGPVIFVAAPHHNQFLDPILLASEIWRETHRRVSFLIAAKSMHQRMVGFLASLMNSSMSYTRTPTNPIHSSHSYSCVFSSRRSCSRRGSCWHRPALALSRRPMPCNWGWHVFHERARPSQTISSTKVGRQRRCRGPRSAERHRSPNQTRVWWRAGQKYSTDP
jgi:hypothetical protein